MLFVRVPLMTGLYAMMLALVPVGSVTAAPTTSRMTDAHILQQATAHVSQQEYASAILLYRMYLGRHPQNDEIRGALAQTMAWNKQYPEALRLYDELLKRHPKDHDLRTAYGRILAWTGQHNDAEAAFYQVLRSDPKRLDTREALGDLYRWSGREAEAAVIYLSLLEQAPNPGIETKLEALDLPKVQPPTLAYEPVRSTLIPDPPPLVSTVTHAQAIPVSPRLPADRGPGFALPYRRFLSVGYGYSSYSKHLPNDNTITLEGGMPIGDMTLVGRYEHIHRFGFNDHQISAELYRPLWTGSWTVIHGTVGPDAHVIPQWSAGGTVYQSLASLSSSLAFLEPFVGYQSMHFRTTTVHMTTPGLNLYLPFNMWITESLYLVPTTGASTLLSQLTWRPAPRVQAFVSGSFGTQGERLTAEQDIRRIPTTTFKAGLEVPVADHWSIGLVGTKEARTHLYDRYEGRAYLTYVW